MQGVRIAVVALGTRLYAGCWPIAAQGSERLESVTLQRNGKQWDVSATTWPADFIWCPISSWLRCSGAASKMASPLRTICNELHLTDVFCAGEPTGIGGVDLALLEGANSRTRRQPTESKKRRTLRAVIDSGDSDLFMHSGLHALDPHLKTLATDMTFVCRCEDVSFGVLRARANWRDAKLQTRCGMGPCQGRICGAATEFLFGWDPDSVSSSTRPPVFPALVSSLGFLSTLDCQGDAPTTASATHQKETA